jgi:hypothetical protein
MSRLTGVARSGCACIPFWFVTTILLILNRWLDILHGMSTRAHHTSWTGSLVFENIHIRQKLEEHIFNPAKIIRPFRTQTL